MSSPRSITHFPDSLESGSITLQELRHYDIDVKTRITNFVNGCVEVIKELDLRGFKKFLQITSQYGYQFRQITPELSLADCMNIMIGDYNEIKNTNPLVGYYYNAMLMEFLQRSLHQVNATQEHIDKLDTKIIENFENFKASIE
jgi:hypothetical protein